MSYFFEDIVDASYLPKFVRLEENHYACVFSLMKLLPAIHIIKKALAEGLIRENTRILETSSGTFAKGLALVCNRYGLKLTIVSDAAIDAQFKTQLENLGAQIELVADTGGKGIQHARLERLNQLRQDYPDHYWPSQYDNPANRESYYEVAALMLHLLPAVQFLAGPVGSGGSMSGMTTLLRSKKPGLRAVGIDTHRSVLFGQADGKRVLRGLGNSIMPGNLLHCLFDEIHWLPADCAFSATRLLHRAHRIFAGPTSGASYLVGKWLAQQNPKQTVVSVMPDSGWRYPEIFAGTDAPGTIIPQPNRVRSPLDAVPSEWNYMNWARRTCQSVMSEAEHRQSFSGQLPSGLIS